MNLFLLYVLFHVTNYGPYYYYYYYYFYLYYYYYYYSDNAHWLCDLDTNNIAPSNNLISEPYPLVNYFLNTEYW